MLRSLNIFDRGRLQDLRKDLETHRLSCDMCTRVRKNWPHVFCAGEHLIKLEIEKAIKDAVLVKGLYDD